MKSKKWLFAGIGLQLGVGYTIGFLTFFFGTLLTTREFGEAWMPILGWALVAFFVGVLTVLIIRNKRRISHALTASAQ